MSGFAPELVSIPVDGLELACDLSIPDNPRGLVLLVDERGAGTFDVHHTRLAELWYERGLATLAVDLETPDEEHAMQVDPERLTGRLLAATDWVLEQPALMDLPIGYFGIGSAAAAGLLAAARRSGEVSAVVSCGGRPDLVMASLDHVHAPTLFVVGANDHHAVALDEAAATRPRGSHRIAVVDHASHRVIEPGTTDAVARLAGDWFLAELQPALDSLREARSSSRQAGRESGCLE